jgi:CrcB protein
MIWLIGFGGSLGALARYLLSIWIAKKRRSGHPFPLATWLINITGSFLLGWLTHLYMAGRLADWLWFGAGVGFCGAYTTFSTFGYETLVLIQANAVKTAIRYVALSVTVSLISAMIGLAI